MLQKLKDSKTCDSYKPVGRSNLSSYGPVFKTGFTFGCWKCNIKLNQREQELLLIDEDENYYKKYSHLF